MHSHNIVAAMLKRLTLLFLLRRTAASLQLVTGHPQTAGNNKQSNTEVGKDPGCKSWLKQELDFSFRVKDFSFQSQKIVKKLTQGSIPKPYPTLYPLNHISTPYP